MANIDNVPEIMNPLIAAYEYDLSRQTGSSWDYIHRTLKDKINMAGMNIQERDIGTIEAKLRTIFPDTTYYAAPIQELPSAPAPSGPTQDMDWFSGAAKEKKNWLVGLVVLAILYFFFSKK